jgi:thiamine-monophosphate kinase
MTELELVAALRRRGHGIGDDCAVVRSPGSKTSLLFTTDLFIEDVHFLRGQRPEQCGHRALARGLSDIAAMGGDPKWCLVSLALASWAGARWVERFYDGLLALARRHRTRLVGGDLSRSDRVTADIAVVGTVPQGEALLRRGAAPGDGIYVSGALGGLPRLPEPRLKLGKALRRRATACMDLSDGLSIDLHRLCIESGVAAWLDRPIPVAPKATLDAALHAGEDYELLFTARREPMRSLDNVPVTRIGSIVEGRPGAITLFGRELQVKGYDHFRTDQGGRPRRPSRPHDRE